MKHVPTSAELSERAAEGGGGGGGGGGGCDGDMGGTMEMDYECESPDEEALVQAADAVGASLLHRGMNTVTCRFQIPGHDALPRSLQLKVVGIHAFNSTRKRMSIVMSNGDGTAVV